jgi:signal transduction histidine kinase
VARRVVLSIPAVAATALLAVALVRAHEAPELTPGGAGTAALLLQAAAGTVTAVLGLAAAWRGETPIALGFGACSLGIAARVFPEPVSGSLLFTFSLVGMGLAAAGIVQAALSWPDATRRFRRVLIVAAYLVLVIAAGVVPQLVFDPARAGCLSCSHNLLLIHSDPGLAASLARTLGHVAAYAEFALALIVLIAAGSRAGVGRALALPVAMCAAVALVLLGLEDVRSARGLAPETGLWLGATGALLAAALATLARPARAIGLRAGLGRLSAELPDDADGLEAGLALVLHDPKLGVLLADPATGAPVRPDGTPAPSLVGDHRSRTAIQRHGRTVGWIDHRADLEAIPELTQASAQTAGLVVEREYLRAALVLRERELQQSAVRLVAAGEPERRRLERELHDGPQGRLIGIGLALELMSRRAQPDDHNLLQDAVQRARDATAQLRRLGHGRLFDAEGGGLRAALLTLERDHADTLSIAALPDRRLDEAVEVSVFRLLAAVLRAPRASRAPIIARVDTSDGATVELDVPGADAALLTDAVTHASARVAALGGQLAVDATASGVRVQAQIAAPTQAGEPA